MKKLKVGDKVIIKSLSWYHNQSQDGTSFRCGSDSFVREMSIYCGREMTIAGEIKSGGYLLKEDPQGWRWVPEMFETEIEKILENFDVYRIYNDNNYVIIDISEKIILDQVFNDPEEAWDYIRNKLSKEVKIDSV